MRAFICMHSWMCDPLQYAKDERLHHHIVSALLCRLAFTLFIYFFAFIHLPTFSVLFCFPLSLSYTYSYGVPTRSPLLYLNMRASRRVTVAVFYSFQLYQAGSGVRGRGRADTTTSLNSSTRHGY
mmetsp:Transcript_40067/g.103697  ORF Transcript_40067/g.103697 Transcript_40067/m.103697 type:complete len:125 (-) Transcript_40067:1700-2074(-)